MDNYMLLAGEIFEGDMIIKRLEDGTVVKKQPPSYIDNGEVSEKNISKKDRYIAEPSYIKAI